MFLAHRSFQNLACYVRDLLETRMGRSGQSSSQPVQDGREKDVCPFYLRDLHIAFTFLLSRWASMTPLRQFKGVPAEVTRKAEGKQFVSDDLVS
jgi:hypothetical protein